MDKLKRSQNQIIKDHLLTGQSITRWQAIELYRIATLLEGKGLTIQRKRVHKDGKHWNVYWLDADNLASGVQS